MYKAFSVDYNVGLQCRCMLSLTAEQNNPSPSSSLKDDANAFASSPSAQYDDDNKSDYHRFLIGTSSPKYSNSIHVVDFNEADTSLQCSYIIPHHRGEIWSMSMQDHPSHSGGTDAGTGCTSSKYIVNKLVTSYSNGHDFEMALWNLTLPVLEGYDATRRSGKEFDDSDEDQIDNNKGENQNNQFDDDGPDESQMLELIDTFPAGVHQGKINTVVWLPSSKSYERMQTPSANV